MVMRRRGPSVRFEGIARGVSSRPVLSRYSVRPRVDLVGPQRDGLRDSWRDAVRLHRVECRHRDVHFQVSLPRFHFRYSSHTCSTWHTAQATSTTTIARPTKCLSANSTHVTGRSAGSARAAGARARSAAVSPRPAAARSPEAVALFSEWTARGASYTGVHVPAAVTGAGADAPTERAEVPARRMPLVIAGGREIDVRIVARRGLARDRVRGAQAPPDAEADDGGDEDHVWWAIGVGRAQALTRPTE